MTSFPPWHPPARGTRALAIRLSAVLLAASALVLPAALRAADDYTPAPESVPDPSIPHGEVLTFSFAQSTLYPGTERAYWVYIPRQYRPETPACLYVSQDSVQPAGAPNVLDALIARHEMPVTIGVFVAPGQVHARVPEKALDRYNRSVEYDSLGDTYVRFLLEELLPEVERQKATDGRPIRLSTRAADRAIGGSSSGAIAAFTAAWERPDAFSRVFSTIGTYVGLRGGDRYPGLIRKVEPKPIRVFLQDGSNDQNAYGGDWWMANQTMERALRFAGYSVDHVWGDGGHTGKQAAAVFPNALRFLWKDWPKPVEAGASQNATLASLLIPGKGWEKLPGTYKTSDGVVSDKAGVISFNDGPAGTVYRVTGDAVTPWDQALGVRHGGQAYGPDGTFYGVLGTDTIVAYTPSGRKVVADGLDRANDLVISHTGMMYVTSDPPARDLSIPSRIFLIRPDGTKAIVDSGLKFANGLMLSPDQSLLYVDDSRSHFVYSYVIAPDGTLVDKQRFCTLYVADTEDDTSADGMRVDTEGRLYVTTHLGIQVCDQTGRVAAILPTPTGKPSSLGFGGPGFDTLYAACGTSVYRRTLHVRGYNPWSEPVKPLKPKL